MLGKALQLAQGAAVLDCFTVTISRHPHSSDFTNVKPCYERCRHGDQAAAEQPGVCEADV